MGTNPAIRRGLAVIGGGIDSSLGEGFSCTCGGSGLCTGLDTKGVERANGEVLKEVEAMAWGWGGAISTSSSLSMSITFAFFETGIYLLGLSAGDPLRFLDDEGGAGVGCGRDSSGTSSRNSLKSTSSSLSSASDISDSRRGIREAGEHKGDTIGKVAVSIGLSCNT